MGPIVKIKKWRARKAREAEAARLRLQIIEIRNARAAYRSFVDRCPKGDPFCAYRDAIQHAGLAIAQAEKDAAARLEALTRSNIAGVH